jgi:hypothetical protein
MTSGASIDDDDAIREPKGRQNTSANELLIDDGICCCSCRTDHMMPISRANFSSS